MSKGRKELGGAKKGKGGGTQKENARVGKPLETSDLNVFDISN